MTGMSDYLEVKFNDALFNNVSFSVTEVFVGLHTADPTDVKATADANEITDSGYIRKAGSFGAPHATAGTCANDVEILYEAFADVATVVITHFSLYDAATLGNYLGSGSLATSKSFSQGDVPRFPVGSLVATMS